MHQSESSAPIHEGSVTRLGDEDSENMEEAKISKERDERREVPVEEDQDGYEDCGPRKSSTGGRLPKRRSKGLGADRIIRISTRRTESQPIADRVKALHREKRGTSADKDPKGLHGALRRRAKDGKDPKGVHGALPTGGRFALEQTRESASRLWNGQMDLGGLQGSDMNYPQGLGPRSVVMSFRNSEPSRISRKGTYRVAESLDVSRPTGSGIQSLLTASASPIVPSIPVEGVVPAPAVVVQQISLDKGSDTSKDGHSQFDSDFTLVGHVTEEATAQAGDSVDTEAVHQAPQQEALSHAARAAEAARALAEDERREIEEARAAPNKPG